MRKILDIQLAVQKKVFEAAKSFFRRRQNENYYNNV